MSLVPANALPNFTTLQGSSSLETPGAEMKPSPIINDE